MHEALRRKIVFLAALLLLAWQGLAEEPQIRFRHLTTDQGLSQNSIYAILEDSQGFLWFGTQDGLNQYSWRYYY